MAYHAAGTIIPSELYLMQAQSKRPGIFPYLNLPAEIRNKIYEFVFEECLIEVRIARRRRQPSGGIDRLPLEHQNTLQNRLDDSPQFERLRVVEKLPYGKDPLPNPKADSKQLRQPATLVQAPSPGVPQKAQKQYQYGRQSGKEGHSHLCHKVVSPLTAMEGGNPAVYHVPFNFLFASRQIYGEALCVLYAKAIFRFTSSKTINRFLSTTPPRALQAIQGLEIYHATHGEPELTKNRKFKISADKNWLTTCQQLSEKLTDVKKLRLNLEINDWPSQLSLQEEWAEPILFLRRSGLDRVDANLAHFAFSPERLQEAARSLEIAMMSDKGRIAKDAHKRRMLQTKRKQKKPVETKARKVLIIKMDNH